MFFPKGVHCPGQHCDDDGVQDDPMNVPANSVGSGMNKKQNSD